MVVTFQQREGKDVFNFRFMEKSHKRRKRMINMNMKWLRGFKINIKPKNVTSGNQADKL